MPFPFYENGALTHPGAAQATAKLYSRCDSTRGTGASSSAVTADPPDQYLLDAPEGAPRCWQDRQPRCQCPNPPASGTATAHPTQLRSRSEPAPGRAPPTCVKPPRAPGAVRLPHPPHDTLDPALALANRSQPPGAPYSVPTPCTTPHPIHYSPLEGPSVPALPPELPHNRLMGREAGRPFMFSRSSP